MANLVGAGPPTKIDLKQKETPQIVIDGQNGNDGKSNDQTGGKDQKQPIGQPSA